MGRNRSNYSKHREEQKNLHLMQTPPSLQTQGKRELNSKIAYGDKKGIDKETDRKKLQAGEDSHIVRDKIYSFKTKEDYEKIVCGLFLPWVAEHYPDCKNIADAFQYADEWLSLYDIDRYSASTQASYRTALAKLFGVKSTAFHPAPKKRHRADFKNNRLPAKRDVGFNPELHSDLVKFVDHTGLRKCSLESLHGGCVIRKEDGNAYIHQQNKSNEFGPMTAKTKGGRNCDIIIMGPPDYVAEIEQMINSIPKNQLVFGKIPSHMNPHSDRHVYADLCYLSKARSYEEVVNDNTFWNPHHYNGPGLPEGGYENCLYRFRKDRKGQWLDKKAMFYAAQMLGHNRIDVCAEFYISIVNWLPGYGPESSTDEKK